MKVKVRVRATVTVTVMFRVMVRVVGKKRWDERGEKASKEAQAERLINRQQTDGKGFRA